MKLSQVIGLSVVVLGCAMPMQAAFANESESSQQGSEVNSESRESSAADSSSEAAE